MHSFLYLSIIIIIILLNSFGDERQEDPCLTSRCILIDFVWPLFAWIDIAVVYSLATPCIDSLASLDIFAGNPELPKSRWNQMPPHSIQKIHIRADYILTTSEQFGSYGCCLWFHTRSKLNLLWWLYNSLSLHVWRFVNMT